MTTALWVFDALVLIWICWQIFVYFHTPKLVETRQDDEDAGKGRTQQFYNFLREPEALTCLEPTDIVVPEEISKIEQRMSEIDAVFDSSRTKLSVEERNALDAEYAALISKFTDYFIDKVDV